MSAVARVSGAAGGADPGRTGIDSSPRFNMALRCAVFLEGGTILGTETFRLVSFSGQENLSSPFQYQLELHADTDPARGTAFDFAQLVGRPVTVGIAIADDADAMRLADDHFDAALKGGAATDFTLFNGIVAAFAMREPGVYEATMRPALWTLSLTNAYRILTQKSIHDAIGEVLSAHGIDHSLTAVSGSDNPAVTRVQDWFQAGESDLDFVQRLMSKAHIYYYFRHTGSSHQVVFANRPDYPQVYEDGRELFYASTSAEPLHLEWERVLTQYRYERTLTSSGVNGVLARQEEACNQDPVAQFQTFNAASSTLGKLPFHRYRACQYGGSDNEQSWDTQRTVDALDTSATSLSGASHCPRFRAGYQFKTADETQLKFNPSAVRPSLSKQGFVLTQVQHQASLDGTYSNQFQATEADGFVAPFSPQDTQQGAVLARVVGATPEDWRYYGRDVFDPELSSVKDSQGSPSSLGVKGLYVQFATGGAPVWVKLAPHMLTVPENGVVVTVARSSDADELPEIQSILQSNGHLTVTPSGWLANTSVGSNYSTSYGDSLSVRYGRTSRANLQQAVSIVTAQYDSGQFRDSSYSQGGGYSYSTAEQGRSGMLSKSDSYGCTYSTFDAAETKSHSIIDNSDSTQVMINTTSDTTISGVSSSTSNVGVSNSTSTTGVVNSTQTTGSVTSTSTTGSSVSTSVTGSSNSVSATGMVNSASATGMVNSASATGMSSSANATGMANQVSVTGMSNSVGATGMNNSVNLTGMNNEMRLLGVGNSLSLTGSSTSTSLTGSNITTNITGENTNLNVTGVVNDISVRGMLNEVKVVAGATNTISVKTAGPVIDIDLDGALVLHMDPAVISLHVPGLDLKIETGIDMIL